MKRWFVLLLLFLTAVPATLLLWSNVVLAHGNTIHVEMFDDHFEPNELNIEVGTTVEFVNVGQDDHWPASDIHPTHQIYSEFDPRHGIKPGETWEFTFNKAGTWRMHDHLNASTTGKIVVSGDDSQTENAQPNWFVRTWRAIMNWFHKRGLKENADIYSNDSQLQAYVEKFGIVKTASHLYELAGSNEACHTAAHIAGRYAYQAFGADVFRSHAPECNSGTIHGATEAFFAENGTENIAESTATVCNDQLNAYFSHECLHGVGHGLMAWAAYDIHEALSLCDNLGAGAASCYSGVFMENVVGGLSGATGHTTKYLSDDPHMPCNVVDEKYRDACYFYQTSRMIQLFNGDLDKIAQECESEQARPYSYSCFGSLGRDAANVLDVSKTISFCQTAKTNESNRQACLLGGADLSFVTVDQKQEALQYCNSVKDTYRGSCFNLIFQRVPAYLSDEHDQQAFCQDIPADQQGLCYNTVNAS